MHIIKLLQIFFVCFMSMFSTITNHCLHDHNYMYVLHNANKIYLCFVIIYIVDKMTGKLIYILFKGVPPSKTEYIGDLVEPLTQAMWEFLHQR
jgi:hypothetical protein